MTGPRNNSLTEAAFSTKSTAHAPPRSENPCHLVLVGGGHAHVQVIRALNSVARSPYLQVTLIDSQSSASYSGMVPGAVAKVYRPEDTQLQLEPLCKWAGINFIHDQVVDVDLEEKKVMTKHWQTPIEFDAISLDIGSTSRGLGDVPGAKEYTIPTRPIQKLVQHIHAAEDQLEECPRLVVIGGGVAGIELSMAVTTRWQQLFPDTKCTIIDGNQELLPQESSSVRSLLGQILSSKNIHVHHGSTVKEVSNDEVILQSGDKLPYTHCIWATGAGAHDLAFQLAKTRGLATNKHGWIRVNSKLQSLSHPFVFAAGDCAVIEGLPKGPPPKAGVYAVRSGPILVENLPNFLSQKDLTVFEPQDDFLKILVCGDGTAIAFRFGLALYGKWVFELKNHIDQSFMDLFRAEKLPILESTSNTYDTSQYDASAASLDYLAEIPPVDSAKLLRRTDDDVDYKKAWAILRRMGKDATFRKEVLQNIRDITELVA